MPDMPFDSPTEVGTRFLNAQASYERELELLDQQMELRRYEPAPALGELIGDNRRGKPEWP